MEKYYRHNYGGIYKFITHATYADDKSSMTVYKHVYPFEEKVYVRRTDEFVKKFSEISNEELELEMSKEIEGFKKEINNKRTEIETVSLSRLLQEKAKSQSYHHQSQYQSFGC